jgi:hypothetical protein
LLAIMNGPSLALALGSQQSVTVTLLFHRRMFPQSYNFFNRVDHQCHHHHHQQDFEKPPANG